MPILLRSGYLSPGELHAPWEHGHGGKVEVRAASAIPTHSGISKCKDIMAFHHERTSADQ